MKSLIFCLCFLTNALPVLIAYRVQQMEDGHQKICPKSFVILGNGIKIPVLTELALKELFDADEQKNTIRRLQENVYYVNSYIVITANYCAAFGRYLKYKTKKMLCCHVPEKLREGPVDKITYSIGEYSESQWEFILQQGGCFYKHNSTIGLMNNDRQKTSGLYYATELSIKKRDEKFNISFKHCEGKFGLLCKKLTVFGREFGESGKVVGIEANTLHAELDLNVPILVEYYKKVEENDYIVSVFTKSFFENESCQPDLFAASVAFDILKKFSELNQSYEIDPVKAEKKLKNLSYFVRS